MYVVGLLFTTTDKFLFQHNSITLINWTLKVHFYMDGMLQLNKLKITEMLRCPFTKESLWE